MPATRYARNGEPLAALLKIGETLECLTIDFKQRYEPGSSDEIRKDIAAFANSNGGVLLVGVSERAEADGRKVAAGLCPINPDATRELICNALKSGIFPRPDVEVAIHSYSYETTKGAPREGAVVAVNVMPSPVAIVCELESGTPGIAIPFRIDHGNDFPSPAKAIEMLTATKERRILVLLDELASERMKVLIASEVVLQRLETQQEANKRAAAEEGGMMRVAGTPKLKPVPLDGGDVDVAYIGHDQRCLTLRITRGESSDLIIPLGLIREVWAVDDQAMGVVLDCALVITRNAGCTAALRTRSPV